MVARRSTFRVQVCAALVFGLSIDAGRSAEPAALREGVTRDEPRRVSHGVDRASVPARAPAASARHPFEGYWAADRAACRNPDSADRMAIRRGTIDWYETRCSIHAIAPAGRGAWHLDLACRGEGQHMEAHATVSLSTIDALTFDDGPIGPSRRQRYIRCRPD